MTARCIVCRQYYDQHNILQQCKRRHTTLRHRQLNEQNLWTERCVKTFCSLVGICSDHLLYQALSESKFCNTCLGVLRDVDFTLKQLEVLTHRIKSLGASLMQSLEQNYEEIPDRESYPVTYQDFEQPINANSVSLTYNEIVKIVFEKIKDSNENEEFYKRLFKILERNTKSDPPPVTPTNIGGELEAPIVGRKRTRLTNKSSVKLEQSEDSVANTCKLEIDIDFDDGFDNPDHDPDFFIYPEQVGGVPNLDFESSSSEDIDDRDDDEEWINPGKRKNAGKNTIFLSPDLKLKCPEDGCKVVCSDENCLANHTRKVHQGDSTPYWCPLCPKKFQTRENLKYHIKRKKSNGERHDSLNDDDDDEVSKIVHTCDVCDMKFYKADLLAAHKRKVHDGDPTPHWCTVCPKKFAKRRGWRTHAKRHQRQQPETTIEISCDDCNKLFSSKEALRRHRNKVHKEENGKQCSFCGLKIKDDIDNKLFTEHENIHKSSPQPFTCTICNAVYTNSYNLIEHMRVHEDKLHVCDTCGVRCSSAKYLLQHMSLHDESYVGHRCTVCNHKFLSQSLLNQHMLRHSTKKTFICDVCGISFKYSSGLKRHYRLHTNDYKFVCKICGKGFTAGSFLNRHEEIHSGTLSYECHVCHKMFRSKNNLLQHVRIHGPKDPNKKKRIRIKKVQDKVSSTDSSAIAMTSTIESDCKDFSSARPNESISKEKHSSISISKLEETPAQNLSFSNETITSFNLVHVGRYVETETQPSFYT